ANAGLGAGEDGRERLVAVRAAAARWPSTEGPGVFVRPRAQQAQVLPGLRELRRPRADGGTRGGLPALRWRRRALQVRRPEGGGDPLGGQPADLQSTFSGLLRPLRDASLVSARKSEPASQRRAQLLDARALLLGRA